jgi:hypothetical protein
MYIYVSLLEVVSQDSWSYNIINLHVLQFMETKDVMIRFPQSPKIKHTHTHTQQGREEGRET